VWLITEWGDFKGDGFGLWEIDLLPILPATVGAILGVNVRFCSYECFSELRALIIFLAIIGFACATVI
jgi:hypothetical protein